MAFNREVLQKLRNAQRGKSRRWYNIQDIGPREAEVFIYDVIGQDWFGNGVTAAQFVQDLRALDADKILLRINSPGGDVNEGVAIRNALIEHPAEIETRIDGAAYSTASWVGLGAETVLVAPHATMMIHKPWDIMAGDDEAFRREADILSRFGDNIADMYVEKAGGDRQEWLNRMSAETWYSDAEAVEAGLADDIFTAAEPSRENTFDRSILALFKHPPPELLEQQTAPNAAAPRNELTKRAAEEALREAGLSNADAKAVVSRGWPALESREVKDGAASNESVGDEIAQERLRFEAFRARQLVPA